MLREIPFVLEPGTRIEAAVLSADTRRMAVSVVQEADQASGSVSVWDLTGDPTRGPVRVSWPRG